jgi:hypothetical protein
MDTHSTADALAIVEIEIRLPLAPFHLSAVGPHGATGSVGEFGRSPRSTAVAAPPTRK